MSFEDTLDKAIERLERDVAIARDEAIALDTVLSSDCACDCQGCRDAHDNDYITEKQLDKDRAKADKNYKDLQHELRVLKEYKKNGPLRKEVKV